MAWSSWLHRARLGIVAALTYAFFFSGGDPNGATRFSLTEALVVRHAPDITPVHWRTIDKGYKKERFFADKAPGLSFLATGPFAVMRAADRAASIDPDAREAQLAKLYVLTLIFAGGAGVATTLLLRRLAVFLGASARSAELVAFAYAFGTIAFPFSTVLFGHQLAAMLLLGALVLALERRELGSLATPRVLASLGALWSLALIVEYPTAFAIAPAGIATLAWLGDGARKDGRAVLSELARALGWIAAGGVPVLAVHVAFSFWAYGKFALPYVYVSEPYFRAHMSGGLLGIGLPKRIATVGTLVSPYRGILFLSPVLALSAVGLGAWVASGKGRSALRVAVPTLAVYVLFLCSYYAWDGGGSTGPRHILPALPLFMVGIAFFADRSRAAFLLTLALTVVSSAIMLANVAVLVQQPQGDVFAMNPFYDIVLSKLAHGLVAINTQDAFIPFGRADSAWNLGTMLGLSPRASLAVIVALWGLAYLLPAAGGARKGPASAPPDPAHA
jgi:hypothetical protein